MVTLHSCEPYFVNCLVPNTHKKPGDVEQPLVMHQLTCNGALEGIRICMQGFPNCMYYLDFKLCYAILGTTEINSSSAKNRIWLRLKFAAPPFSGHNVNVHCVGEWYDSFKYCLRSSQTVCITPQYSAYLWQSLKLLFLICPYVASSLVIFHS